MKKYIIFFALIFFTLNVKAQLGYTKSEVIEKYGEPNKRALTQSGDTYFAYERQLNTNASGVYTQGKVLYFMENGQGIITCYCIKYVEPLTEFNPNIVWYNTHFVLISSFKWKDYTTGLTYDMYTNDGLCITEVYKL